MFFGSLEKVTNLSLSLPLQDPPSLCPPLFTYEPSTGSCYHVEDVLVGGIHGAWEACAQHGDNVHLLAIETDTEQDFLATYIPDQPSRCTGPYSRLL